MGKYYKSLSIILILLFIFLAYYRFTGNFEVTYIFFVLLFVIISNFLVKTYVRIRTYRLSHLSLEKSANDESPTGHSIAVLYTSKISNEKLLKKCIFLKDGNFSEIYVISPVKNDELRKKLTEHNIKFVCSAELNYYNNSTWPRQKGQLESAISYFFDKFAIDSGITTVIYDFVKFENYTTVDYSGLFNENGTEAILFEEEPSKNVYFNNVANAIITDNNTLFNAVSLRNSCIKKIPSWGQFEQPIRNMILANIQTLSIKVVNLDVNNSSIKKTNQFFGLSIQDNYEKILKEYPDSSKLSKSSREVIYLYFYKLYLQGIICLISLLAIILLNNNWGAIICSLIIYETIYFTVSYLMQEDILLSLSTVKKIIFIKYLANLKKNNVLPVIFLCIIISISFITLNFILGLFSTAVICFIFAIWLTFFVSKIYKLENIIKSYRLLKMKTFFISVMFIVEIIVVFISLLGISSFSKVSAIDTWLGRVNNQRLNLSIITENAKLTNAAYKKVQYMFLKNTEAHSDPIDAFILASGYDPEKSAELMYVGVGSLDNIFRYWVSKLDYYNQIVNPEYCEAGFWSETRTINGVAVNKSVLYLSKPKTGCPNQILSSSSSTSTQSTLKSLSSQNSNTSSRSISTTVNSSASKTSSQNSKRSTSTSSKSATSSQVINSTSSVIKSSLSSSTSRLSSDTSKTTSISSQSTQYNTNSNTSISTNPISISTLVTAVSTSAKPEQTQNIVFPVNIAVQSEEPDEDSAEESTSQTSTELTVSSSSSQETISNDSTSEESTNDQPNVSEEITTNIPLVISNSNPDTGPNNLLKYFRDFIAKSFSIIIFGTFFISILEGLYLQLLDRIFIFIESKI